MQDANHDIPLEERRKISMILAVFIMLIVTMIMMTSWQSINEARAMTEYHDGREIENALERFKAELVGHLADSGEWDDELLESGDEAAGELPNRQSTELPRHWHGDDANSRLIDGTASVGNAFEVRKVESQGVFDDVWLLDAGFRPRFQYSIHDRTEHGHMLPDYHTLAQLRDAGRQSGPSASFHRSGNSLIAVALAPVPGDSDFLALSPQLAGGWIVATRKMDQDYLRITAEETQIQNLQLVILGNVAKATPDHRISLSGADGSAIGYVGWTSAIDPFAILKRKLPMILAISAVFVLMALSLMRQAMVSFKALNRMARKDTLSRLPNRTSLMVALRRRVGEHSSSALALIDLDGFKQINDHHGHGTGDDVIRFVAERLRQTMPENAFVARLGGDEFAVLFSDIDNRAHVFSSIQAFIESFVDPVLVGGHKLKIGASVGLNFYAGYMRGMEVLRRADIAMYAAKQAGKMQWATFKRSMDQDRIEKTKIKDQLENAVDSDEFSVVYQPILNARTGQISSLEALARWNSPVLGNVSADVFIPIAEEFGLIGSLGEHILNRVIQDIAKLPPLRIALNVSAVQISSRDFETRFKEALREHRIAPSRFELEVTETHLLRSSELLHRSIHSLGHIGVRHILDDFGSGYASIGFLRKFPFAAVKIDRSIIAECAWSEKARAVLTAVVALAHSQDMEVIAEGVETIEQAEVARASGCDHLQGWLFARAMSAEDIAMAYDRDQTLAAIAA